MTPQAEREFEDLKEVFMTAPMLQYRNPDLPFVMGVDVLDHGVGANSMRSIVSWLSTNTQEDTKVFWEIGNRIARLTFYFYISADFFFLFAGLTETLTHIQLCFWQYLSKGFARLISYKCC